MTGKPNDDDQGMSLAERMEAAAIKALPVEEYNLLNPDIHKLSRYEIALFRQLSKNFTTNIAVDTPAKQRLRVLKYTLTSPYLAISSHIIACAERDKDIIGDVQYKQLQSAVSEEVNFLRGGRYENALLLLWDKYWKNPESKDFLNLEKITATYNSFIDAIILPEKAKDYIRARIVPDELQPCLDYCKVTRELMDDGFLSQWLAGEFTYAKPHFRNEAEIDNLSNRLIAPLSVVTTDSGISDKKNKENIESAVKRLKARLVEHETLLWAQVAAQEKERAQTLAATEAKRDAQIQAQREKKILEAEQAIKDADDRIQAELKRDEAFKKTKQPYVFKTPAKHLIGQLERFAGGSAGNKRSAEAVVAMVEAFKAPLDIRDGHVNELANLLLAPANLALVEKIFELKLQTPANTGRSKAESKSYLRHLYDVKAHVETPQGVIPNARDVIEQLLTQDDGILLLAALTHTEARCKAYAGSMTAAKADIQALQTKISKTEAPYTGFTDDFLRDCVDDPQVASLLSARSDREKKEAEIKTQREMLAEEIRQALEGHRVKDRGQGFVPMTYAAPAELKLDGTDLADIMKDKAVADRFHVELRPEDQGPENAKKTIRNARICSNDYDTIYTDVKITATKGTLDHAIAMMQLECDAHERNDRTIQELTSECGFHMSTQGDKTQLLHPEYKIEAMLEGKSPEPLKMGDGSEQRKEKILTNAQEEFEKRQFEQASLIGSAARAGMKVQGVDEYGQAQGEVMLHHPKLGSAGIKAPRGYLSYDDFFIIQKKLDHIADEASVQTVMADEKEVQQGLQPAVPWEIDAGKTVLLLDTAVQNLAAVRPAQGIIRPEGVANEHTWLDMIKETARLPNAVVVIPSVVADMEMRGKIPVYDQDGKRSFKQCNTNFANQGSFHYAIAKATDKLLESASRARMSSDGTVTIEYGANRNLIIMETEDDKNLLEKIHRGEDVYGQGEGEKAISWIAKRLNNPAIIFSNDIAYFRGTPAKGAAADQEAHKAPTRTDSGKPIKHASVTLYLDAELAAREAKLRELLRERGALTLDGIQNAIHDYWKTTNRDAPPRRIVYPATNSARAEIYQFFADGHTQSVERAEAENGNRKSYADPALKKGFPLGVIGRIGPPQKLGLG